MSFQHITAALDLSLPPTDKLVLVILANHADDHGCCFPSLRRVSEKAGLDLRTVQRAVGRLEAAQHLSREERIGQSTYYTLSFGAPHPKVTPITHARAKRGDGIKPGGDGIKPGVTDGTESPPRRHKAAHNQSENLKKDSSGNNHPKVRRKKSPRGTRLPSDFEFSEERRRVATEKRVKNPELEFERFKNHWLAASGSRASKLDWDRTWSNWCSSSYTEHSSGATRMRIV